MLITNVPTPRQIAVVEDLRGPMIQQGGYAACLELAGEGHGDKTRAKATHAAAKVSSKMSVCSLQAPAVWVGSHQRTPHPPLADRNDL